MKKCKECGTTRKVKLFKRFNSCLCSNCYKYYKEHPVNELPKKGEVAYDNQGRVICHICGRAFHKVLTHCKQRHGLTAYEYKKMFGLDVKKGLTSNYTKEKLRKSVQDNYDKVVSENLIKGGKKTRFINGSKGRTKDKVSLQTLKRLKQVSFVKKSLG